MRISLNELKQRLSYNTETGIFIWLPYLYAKKVGREAGMIHPNGYRYIALKPYRAERAHCLAWFYMTGEWPKNTIDHINRITADNRFCNLREATSSEQQANTKLSIRNKSGMRGVCKSSRCNTWRAVIWIDGKSKHLGGFKTKEEAQLVYDKAAKKHFGKFLRSA